MENKHPMCKARNRESMNWHNMLFFCTAHKFATSLIDKKQRYKDSLHLALPQSSKKGEEIFKQIFPVY